MKIITKICCAIIAFIIFIFIRLFTVGEESKPRIWCIDEEFTNCVRDVAPFLWEKYIPPLTWGYNGHLQTIVNRIIARWNVGPWPKSERVFLSLKDGSTLTYDLFQRNASNDKSLSQNCPADVMIIIVPGICNSSQSLYVRTLVSYAQSNGYGCAALNHIGTLCDVEVTSSRIFTYGHTDDVCEMVNDLHTRFPNTNFVAVGYSLGGNLVAKYMGELDKKKPKSLIGGISICQGYNASESSKCLRHWQNLRRFYLFIMTITIKRIIYRHRHILLSEEVKNRYNINEKAVLSARTLPELDEVYTRRIHNFATINDFYEFSSSLYYLKNIDKPMVFINATDDPLIPECLRKPVEELALSRERILYMEVPYGGHLGFYEGGIFLPNSITWLNRSLVALVNALLVLSSSSPLHASLEHSTDSALSLSKS